MLARAAPTGRAGTLRPAARLALRGLMVQASRQGGCDTLSFIHAVRVVRRHLPSTPPFPPRQRQRMVKWILIEILAEPAEQPGPAQPARRQAQDEQLPDQKPVHRPCRPIPEFAL